MPYIEKENRQLYDVKIDNMVDQLDGRPIGEINYVFSRIIWKLFNKNCSYTFGNSLMGMLLCVAQEFYRRKLAKYEDEKITENGDLPEA